jgi:hypothetical protein
MTIEAIAAVAAENAVAQERFVQPAGANFSIHDVARFEAAMSGDAGNAGGAPGAPQGVQPHAIGGGSDFLNSPSIRALFEPLDNINKSTDSIMVNSQKLSANPDAGPGEMVMMLMGAQKFMFECQMTSSVANRTSDGVQELFRQQS